MDYGGVMKIIMQKTLNIWGDVKQYNIKYGEALGNTTLMNRHLYIEEGLFKGKEYINKCELNNRDFFNGSISSGVFLSLKYR